MDGEATVDDIEAKMRLEASWEFSLYFPIYFKYLI
jgi:hypothetical protein